MTDQIELLTNLDMVSEAGAIVVVAFPKPKGIGPLATLLIVVLPKVPTVP